jgi:hypothetical protein
MHDGVVVLPRVVAWQAREQDERKTSVAGRVDAAASIGGVYPPNAGARAARGRG